MAGVRLLVHILVKQNVIVRVGQLLLRPQRQLLRQLLLQQQRQLLLRQQLRQQLQLLLRQQRRQQRQHQQYLLLPQGLREGEGCRRSHASLSKIMIFRLAKPIFSTNKNLPRVMNYYSLEPIKWSNTQLTKKIIL
jgi:hypothetical protein